MDENTYKKSFFSKHKKPVLIILSIPVVIILGAVIFIKSNTSAAADFTDNVLRPLLGANNVIFMEKIFFNASDKFQQMTLNENNIQAPQFISDSQDNILNIGNLDTTVIPPHSKFCVP